MSNANPEAAIEEANLPFWVKALAFSSTWCVSMYLTCEGEKSASTGHKDPAGVSGEEGLSHIPRSLRETLGQASEHLEHIDLITGVRPQEFDESELFTWKNCVNEWYKSEAGFFRQCRWTARKIIAFVQIEELAYKTLSNIK